MLNVQIDLITNFFSIAGLFTNLPMILTSKLCSINEDYNGQINIQIVTNCTHIFRSVLSKRDARYGLVYKIQT